MRWDLIRLGDHRVACLLEDVGTGQVGGFRGEVGIGDATLGGALVLHRDLQVADHLVEAVLGGTQRGALRADRVDRLVDVADDGVDVATRRGVVDLGAARTGVVRAGHGGDDPLRIDLSHAVVVAVGGRGAAVGRDRDPGPDPETIEDDWDEPDVGPDAGDVQ